MCLTMSFIKIRNSRGPRIEPRGTPASTDAQSVKISQCNRKCGIVVKDLPPQNSLIEFCWFLPTKFRKKKKTYNDFNVCY